LRDEYKGIGRDRNAQREFRLEWVREEVARAIQHAASKPHHRHRLRVRPPLLDRPRRLPVRGPAAALARRRPHRRARAEDDLSIPLGPPAQRVGYQVQAQRPFEDEDEIRALTLTSNLLAAGILAQQKLVENRTWRLPAGLAGRWIALHVGSAAYDPTWVRRHVLDAFNVAKAERGPPSYPGCNPSKGLKLPSRRAIVGLVRFGGQHRFKPGEEKEDRWALGPICWEVSSVVPLLPPIHAVDGNLGLWRVKGHLRPEEFERLKAAIRVAERDEAITDLQRIAIAKAAAAPKPGAPRERVPPSKVVVDLQRAAEASAKSVINSRLQSLGKPKQRPQQPSQMPWQRPQAQPRPPPIAWQSHMQPRPPPVAWQPHMQPRPPPMAWQLQQELTPQQELWQSQEEDEEEEELVEEEEEEEPEPSSEEEDVDPGDPSCWGVYAAAAAAAGQAAAVE